MSKVYKMLKKALKNDIVAKAVLISFNAYKILNPNSDWDWDYEESKCEFVREMVEQRNKYTSKAILIAYKKQMKQTPYLWYDEFEHMARNILKNPKLYSDISVIIGDNIIHIDYDQSIYKHL